MAILTLSRTLRLKLIDESKEVLKLAVGTLQPRNVSKVVPLS